MPYELSWHIEKRVVLIRHYGVYSLEDLQNAMVDVIQDYCLPNSDVAVHLIADVRQVERFELGISSLRHIPTLPSVKDFGWVLLLRGQTSPLNADFTMLLGVMSHMLKFHFSMISTLDDALPLLTTIDPSFADRGNIKKCG